jgi:hypothetical protein
VNLRYLLPRLARHFLPELLTRFLLRRSWIIHPGLETRAPRLAVERYLQVLEAHGMTLAGKRILVFGYGGYFAVGVGLLRCGAAHVVLCDKFVPPNDHNNLDLSPVYGDYLLTRQGRVLLRPEYLTLLQGDIRATAYDQAIPSVDMVFSSSVFEHLPSEDMDSITAALAALTRPGGIHLHFINLRDHFFQYPFEMLTFSERTWQRWLNPTSNLNRFRLPDYRRIFEKHFKNVSITVLERNLVAFERIQPRIRPEFLTGDTETDSATLVQVMAYSLKG